MYKTEKTHIWRQSMKMFVVAVALIMIAIPMSSLQAQVVPNPALEAERQRNLATASDATEGQLGAMSAGLGSCPSILGSGPTFMCWMAHGTEAIRSGFSSLAGAFGFLLNESVRFSVLEMGKNIKESGSDNDIRVGWGTLRDVGNIVLIFALLAIGIATILRVEGYGMKQLLAKLIIVAVLINFSFFFTRVVVDASNLVAVQFYKTVAIAEQTEKGNTYGLSGALLDSTEVIRVFPKNADGIDYGAVVQNNFLAILLILVVAVVFLIGAILLLVRYVALILLMILSPLAFVGFVLPSTAALAKKWWSSLVNYSLFAPIFLALVAIGIRLSSSDSLKDILQINNDARFTDNLAQTGALLTHYAIAIGFFVAAIVIAKSLSIAGGETAVKWGGSLRKFGTGAAGAVTVGAGGALLRGTVGRAASSVAGSKFMLDSAKKSRVGGAALKVLRGVGGTSFDARALPGIKDASKELGLGAAAGKGGYQATLEKQAKKRLEFAKGLSKESAASAETWTQDEITEGMRLRGEVGSAEAKETFATKKETSAKTDDEKEKAQKEKEKAQKEKEKAQKDYDDYVRGGRFKERGKKRQETYADNLSERKALGFLWRPRKNREAAGLIRGNLRKSPADVANDAIISAVEKNKPKEDT